MQRKIKIELVIRKSLGYIAILGIIIAFGLLTGKILETISLLIAYTLTRNSFSRQLHLDKSSKCINISILIFVLTIINTLRYNFSILECCFLGVAINYVCNLICFLPSLITGNSKRQKILKYVKNDEDDIEMKCKELGLVNISETVYLYLNNSLLDTALILEVDNSTVMRRVNKFLKANQQ